MEVLSNHANACMFFSEGPTYMSLTLQKISEFRAWQIGILTNLFKLLIEIPTDAP